MSKALTGKGTVSPKLRSRVTSYAAQAGYEPDPFAQGLANRGKSQTTFLCSGALDVGRVTEKLILIQQALSNRGLEVPIYTAAKAPDKTFESQSAMFRQLRRLRPKIIICTALQFVDGVLAELKAYQDDGGIVINYDVPIDIECDQVLFDRETNSYQATRYLLERGHRRLGLVVSKRTPIISQAANLTQNARIRGFERALGEFGLSLQDNFLFEEMMLERGGSHLAKKFLASKNRPTGLCISNDYMALAFMVEIMAAGLRVPEDVSLIGMNDQLVASYCPVPLTSASNPSDEIAQAVIEKTLARIDGDTRPPEKQFVEGKLIERSSVAVLS